MNTSTVGIRRVSTNRRWSDFQHSIETSAVSHKVLLSKVLKEDKPKDTSISLTEKIP